MLGIAIFELLLLYSSVYAAGILDQGPYKAVLKKFYKCKNNGLGQASAALKKVKIGKNSYGYNGNLTLPELSDDNTQVDVHLWDEKEGTWKANYFNTRIKRACTDTLTLARDFITSILAASGESTKDVKCPIKGGTRQMKKWPMDTHFAMPILMYRSFKIDLGIIRNKRRLGCLGIYLDLVPN